MGILQKLFGKKSAARAVFAVTVQINAKVMPIDRGTLFQDPLAEALEAQGLGTSEDGGTLSSEQGEVLYCDVEVDLNENTERAYAFVKETIERLGAPKGSKLHVSRDDVRPIGGLGIYLNGTDLPDEVYASCDSNSSFAEMHRRIASFVAAYPLCQKCRIVQIA